MLNRITLIGRLGKDPDHKHLHSGTQVANFSIAADEGFGEKKRTTWFNCSAFGKMAESAKNHLSKGDTVYVAGPMMEQKSDDKRYWKVMVKELRFLNTKGKSRQTKQDDGSFGDGKAKF